MEMSIAEIISAFFLSGVKLLFTPMGFAGVYADNLNALFQIAVISGLGSIFSSVLFFFLGKGLDKLQSKKKKTKSINFKRNKMIILIKNKFKLFGTSMTIGIISVPLASILVGKYFGKNKMAIPSLVISSFIWSFGITYITAFVVNVIKPLFT